jgi:hypothetical protein
MAGSQYGALHLTILFAGSWLSWAGRVTFHGERCAFYGRKEGRGTPAGRWAGQLACRQRRRRRRREKERSEVW